MVVVVTRFYSEVKKKKKKHFIIVTQHRDVAATRWKGESRWRARSLDTDPAGGQRNLNVFSGSDFQPAVTACAPYSVRV